MARAIDYAQLRHQTMSNGDDSAVTVNTRALIDKVLARYSSEHTTLRELIQNAADAGATRVAIKFETIPSLDTPAPQSADEVSQLRHIIRHHSVKRLQVSNNGQPFTSSDWARLKSIAEGNPDETKIGAFGVGFYSVFADCDEPFVLSGQKTMAFFWKGNALYTRTGELPEPQPETCFFLEYRQHEVSSGSGSPVPDLLGLCQFLSTSLTFVGLEAIELWLDDWNISTFRKKSSPSIDLTLPTNIKRKTEEGLMTIQSVNSQTAQIDASWHKIIGWPRKDAKKTGGDKYEDLKIAGTSLKSFLSRFTSGSTTGHGGQKETKQTKDDNLRPDSLVEYTGRSEAIVFVRLSTLNIRTNVRADFARELERATKKPPPKSTRISVLTSPFDETSIMSADGNKSSSIIASTLFSSVLPTKAGRIFIGFPTAQTTGLSCHVSAPSVIPTVERESIDLNARFISIWNRELLWAAGIGCRLAYIQEMNSLKQKLDRTEHTANQDQYNVSGILPDASRILRQFSAEESTPSSQVGRIIETAFWNCSSELSIEILSSRGILPSKKVRLVAEKLSFLGHVPVVPEELLSSAEGFISVLLGRGFISRMTIDDIRSELEAQALNENQLVEFLKWCGVKTLNQELDKADISSLFEAAVANVKAGPGMKHESTLVELSMIKNYLNTSRLPLDSPLPGSTIPYALSRTLPESYLRNFGWEELQIIPWLKFIIDGSTDKSTFTDEFNITRSESFAAKVLSTMSKNWDRLSQSSKETARELLLPLRIIPTTTGLRIASESYFPTVKAFSDLPIVTTTGTKDKFLLALGVRKTVELNIVFDRLKSRKNSEGQDSSTWSPGELIKYFASVQGEIPSNDMDILKTTAFCTAEGVAEKSPSKYYKVAELYAPNSSLKDLQLPIIQLPFPYRANSAEGRFLNTLGLKNHPSVLDLISIMTSAASRNDKNLYDRAMDYFLSNHYINGYSKFDLSSVWTKPFLLSIDKGFPNLFPPNAIYSDERASVLGFTILHESLRPHITKFGVQSDPSVQSCINALLERPPITIQGAHKTFSYLATRLGEVDYSMESNLGGAKMIPLFYAEAVGGSQKGTREAVKYFPPRFGDEWEIKFVQHVSPSQVFVGRDREYGDLLTYVDFGPSANNFLLKAGSKHEPTCLELVSIVSRDPKKFLNSMGSEKYTGLLRKFAENVQAIKSQKALWKSLKSTPFLLASQDKIIEQKPLIDIKENPIDYDEDEKIERLWSLECASDVVVADNVGFFGLFRSQIKVAPQEDILEEFYVVLGASKLSKHLTFHRRLGAELRDQETANRLQKDIVERSRIFLHEYEKENTSAKNIRHNSKWLKNNLRVLMVQSIAIRISLTSTRATVVEKRTAWLANDSSTLHVTQSYDLDEVSRELIPLLINRPKHHESVVFERILSESLSRLRKRGYNVERILQQREYESRIAESAAQKKFEEEQKRLAEFQREAVNEKPSSTMAPSRPSLSEERTNSMPGAFGELSPDRPERQQPPQQPPTEREENNQLMNPQELFKKFSKRLGLTPQNEANSGRPTNELPRDPKEQSQISQSNVNSAIQGCRPHGSSEVHAPPTMTTLDESKGSYCDSTTEKDLYDSGQRVSGIRCFVSRNWEQYANDTRLLARVQASAEHFARVLLILGSVFKVPASSLHIFYDNHSNTIAFNQAGAVFFNCYYYFSLHASLDGPQGNAAAAEYWYMVFCHELAHNLVKEHSADHEFYLQAISVQHRPSFYRFFTIESRQG